MKAKTSTVAIGAALAATLILALVWGSIGPEVDQIPSADEREEHGVDRASGPGATPDEAAIGVHANSAPQRTLHRSGWKPEDYCVIRIRSEEGKAVPDAAVVWVPNQIRFMKIGDWETKRHDAMRTDTKGEVQIRPGDFESPSRWVVFKEGFAHAVIALPPAGTEKEVVLFETGSFSMLVQDARSGKPIPGIRLMAYHGIGSVQSSAEARVQGVAGSWLRRADRGGSVCFQSSDKDGVVRFGGLRRDQPYRVAMDWAQPGYVRIYDWTPGDIRSSGGQYVFKVWQAFVLIAKPGNDDVIDGYVETVEGDQQSDWHFSHARRQKLRVLKRKFPNSYVDLRFYPGLDKSKLTAQVRSFGSRRGWQRYRAHYLPFSTTATTEVVHLNQYPIAPPGKVRLRTESSTGRPSPVAEGVYARLKGTDYLRRIEANKETALGPGDYSLEYGPIAGLKNYLDGVSFRIASRQTTDVVAKVKYDIVSRKIRIATPNGGTPLMGNVAVHIEPLDRSDSRFRRSGRQNFYGASVEHSDGIDVWVSRGASIRIQACFAGFQWKSVVIRAKRADQFPIGGTGLNIVLDKVEAK